MRLSFTIRDLFWLTLVVAVTMAWYLQWRRSSALQHQLEVMSPFRSGQNVLYDDGRVGTLPPIERNGRVGRDR
jgi:hypothetical protein